MSIFAVTLILTLPAYLYAEEIKIGVVNTEKILRESMPAVAAQKKIEKEFQVRETRIRELSVRIRALQQELEKGTGIADEEGRRLKERDLAGLSRQYQRAQQQIREDLSLRQNEEYGLILERTNQVINELAKKYSYDLILQLQDSVYRSARIDITDQVIKALNAQESVAGKP
ncbi:OmpH family outer membrane protein [uncultured Nitrosomonas sp.]|nr:OmpH family outer membrane protein [uncultured Nitrosomonas sp.]